MEAARPLADHRSAHHSNLCPTCDQADFTSYESLRAYKRSTGYSFCKDCDLRSLVPVTEFRCCDCDRGFADDPALQEHLATKVHTPPLRCDRVHKECNKEFVNETALLQHQTSVVHRPISNIQCMAHKKCKKCFSCPSALLHHLESGSYHPKMTRWKLNKAVREMDADCLITYVPT
jgi:Zinc-finger of C2H2 type